MNARHAARQLALMILFQHDKQGDLHSLSEQLDAPFAVNTLVTDFVRALSQNALATLEDSGVTLAKLIDALDDETFQAENNQDLPLNAPLNPVTLPTTAEMMEQLKSALQAIELGYEALQLPEFCLLAQQPDVQTYTQRLLTLVKEQLTAIDEHIDQHSDDWKLPRMMKMDRCILRLAVGEIVGIDSVAASVSIDEAVELAKQYAHESSYKLINGILGGVAKTLPEAVNAG